MRLNKRCFLFPNLWSLLINGPVVALFMLHILKAFNPTTYCIMIVSWNESFRVDLGILAVTEVPTIW